MNKKELAYLKKQFKEDKTLIRINDIYSVYINGDNRNVLGTMITKFNSLEEKLMQMFFKNFKKALTGKFNVKLFEQNFDENSIKNEDGSYNILNNIIKSTNKNDFVKECDELVNKIIKNYPYDKNIVINFARFTFFRENTSYEMLLTTINKAEIGESQFVYNFEDEKFKTVNQLDPIINLKSPLDAFLYPVWENENINKNKVLYYSSKSNKINTTFVYNVLNCNISLTEKQEKNYFHAILNLIMGGKIKPNKLHAIYEEIGYRFKNEEDNEFRVIGKGLLKDILNSLSIEIKKDVEDSFVEIIGDPDYEFKVDNIIPDKDKKSINIANSNTEIKLTPDNLNNIRQIQNNNGEIFLVVRLNENLQANGFNINIDDIKELDKFIGKEKIPV